ncbi:MAG: ATP-binding cassette domain-containing protein [Cellulophaga sp.]
MILEIDNIELNFNQKKILYGIYLKLETGKIIGLLGRNGSGKTSLLRILFGDLKPKYKTIRIDGIHQRTSLFSKGIIGYLPQYTLLPNKMRLKKAFDLYNISWNNFVNLFESFNIYEKFKIQELSSGERRIVETYLVLFSGKPIILLDEPFSFIAPIYVEKFKSLILEKKKESAILVSDHFYKEIFDVSDTVYFLKNGISKIVLTKKELEDLGYISM